MNEREIGNDKVDWAHILFVEHPQLFLPNLEGLLGQSENEVDGICRIFEEFQIGKKSKVLDLSCGIGRHVIGLAKRGYEVVGYDPSPFYLNRAKELLEENIGRIPNSVRFYAGRMEDLHAELERNGEGDFNAVITLYNSIGYTHAEDDYKLFSDAIKLASNGGILITETENRDWRLQNLFPYSNHDYGDIQIIESWEFDLESSVSKSRSQFYRKDSKCETLHLVLDLPTHMRLYSLHELINLIKHSGWTYKKSFQSLIKLQPMRVNSANIVTVSMKM